MNTNNYNNYYNVNNILDSENEMMIQKDLSNVSDGFKRGNIFNNLYWPYKKGTYNFIPKNDRQKLLLKIMENSFYAHELNLYLDNFPNDQEKIKLYNIYNEKTSQLIDKYNKEYEPLCLYNNDLNEVPWSWEESPWPWEGV